jgi:hypothetical protein
MFDALLLAGCAELVTLRDREGRLLAAQLDILGGHTRHYYHSASDTERAPGCGTAVLAGSWARFLADEAARAYSFGRGSERYKYRYANAWRPLYEVRGFLAPGRALE